MGVVKERLQHPLTVTVNLSKQANGKGNFTTKVNTSCFSLPSNPKRVSTMANFNTGPANGYWKGGRSIASNGYVLIRVGTNHPLADKRGYAYEHRIVASNKLGRWVKPGELVHHLNHNKQDNRPENLEVVSDNAAHLYHHRVKETGKRKPGEPNPIISCACGCGNNFPKYDRTNRPRIYITGHNPSLAETQTAILQALSKGPATISNLVILTGKQEKPLKTALSKMAKQGKITRLGRGIYAGA